VIEKRINSAEALSQAFGVSRETRERLITYEALLRQWQKTINLVAPATLDEAWHRHFADSAQLAAFVPQAAKTLVDLGSGAGFPGLVLAIMLAERGTRVALIESDNRKSAFLREVARQVRVAVDIRIGRIENPATRVNLPAAEVVTSRALAPLSRLLGLAHPLMAAGALGLFPKGREAATEVEEARATWAFEAVLTESFTDREARIVRIRELRSIS
jgi:16S rRNA (guanine527-N7)-methyltransferase